MQRHYLTLNLLKSICFGLAYAVIETNIPIQNFIPTIDYRVLYLLIFAIANISPSLPLFIGNFMLSMATEDMFYWIIKSQIPFSYAWYYPVVSGVPIADVVEVIIAIASYYYYYTHNPIPLTYNIDAITGNKCGMFNAFIHGKTHDEYGAIVLVTASIIGLLTSDSIELKSLAILSLIVGVGIAVDLWCHCFHH